jgi:hypothetical protein
VLDIIPVFYNSVYLSCLFQNDPAVGSVSVLIRKGSQGPLIDLYFAELLKYEPSSSCTEIQCRKQTENRTH